MTPNQGTYGPQGQAMKKESQGPGRPEKERPAPDLRPRRGPPKPWPFRETIRDGKVIKNGPEPQTPDKGKPSPGSSK